MTNWDYWYREGYKKEPWDKIPKKRRQAIVRYRTVKPDACPYCGSRDVQIHNLSREYRNDDTDYEYSCMRCHNARYHPKQPRPLMRPGLQPHIRDFKQWDQLTRQSKMFRIRKQLPMPARCPYCERTVLELHSLSGQWLNTVSDYVWICRTHRHLVDGFKLIRL